VKDIARSSGINLFLPPGLTVTWSQAHKLIQHLRRTGWRVSEMPRGDTFIAYWIESKESYFSISFWSEGVAVIENPEYEYRDDDEIEGLDRLLVDLNKDRWRDAN
jgi:hypothetical protein